jgi:DNA uptake protein ComE-like DNA-binding protein
METRNRCVLRALGALLAVALVLPAASAAESTAPPIDLAHPAADVNDPVASLAPVNTECAKGQVDLNTASAEEIGSRLRLASDPTVKRIIALRPWLKGSDLSSVPGIGPQLAATLAPKTCTTQLVLPAASPLACRSTSEVDLQAASAAQIATRLNLPMVTANALVGARPLPQDLTQVITPRVPGLSQPTANGLLRRRQICVTPAPMLAGGAAWRWATPAGGAVVRRDGFGLIVPPGRVTEPFGAYISVKALPRDVLPRMEGKIHGTWNSGATTVAVQGPWEGTDQDERPAVFHESVDRKPALAIGDGTAVGQVGGKPTVTAVASSLSEFEYGTSTCTPQAAPAGTYPAPLCIESLLDGSLHDEWLRQGSVAGSASGDSLKPKPFCGSLQTGVSLATAEGALPFGITCFSELMGVPYVGGTARWSFTNDAYGSVVFGLATASVVYYQYATDNQSTHGLTGRVETNPFSAELLDWLDISNALFPGQSLHVTKRPSFVGTPVHVEVSASATTAWASINVLLGSLAEMAGGDAQKVYDFAAGARDCAGVPLDEALGCAKTVVEGALHSAQEGLDGRTKLARKLKSVARALKALDVPGVAASVSTSFIVKYQQSHGDGTDATLRNEPNKPSVDALGRNVKAQCLSQGAFSWILDMACQNAFYASLGGVLSRVPAGDSYIARNPSTHRAVLVKPGGVVLDIKDGGTFNCLAATWFVWDNEDVPALNKPLSGDATCGDAGPRHWDMRPVAEGGNIPDDVILRLRPEDAQNGTGSWLINNRSEIQTIPDGGTYLCLAYANPVIWNVPLGDRVPFVGINEWRPVGTAPASCG